MTRAAGNDTEVQYNQCDRLGAESEFELNRTDKTPVRSEVV